MHNSGERHSDFGLGDYVNLHLQAECFVGSHVARMAVNPKELMQVGTGGKENDLKLWDGNRLDAGPTFQAKNVRSLS